MITQQLLTQYQSQYYAWLLTHRAASDSVESLASTLVDSQVDLNPHQVEAALFACTNPLSRGVILADEVGLGKTIEAGLVISQRWAERRRNILIIVPANLRKQWHQELQDKFNLLSLILDAKNYNTIRKQENQNPFLMPSGPVISLATNIRDNAKGKALLTALERAFAELERLGAPKKAIIFTESRLTQEYLLSLLADTHYGEGIVLFNGTNSDARAQAVYKNWLVQHKGTDKISGSKTADTRAALVEHFQERGTVMIATEAGAEGINLQFCSLVINYDLPWNPQRIEQLIGRCHRYGQKFDVVVVNFVDRSNEADVRVYELLAQKFQLFEGIFGASDEVLGAIGSGVDFERRIADIYQNCRDPEAIKSSFEQLQLDLSGEINEAMVKTRQLLLENFDEEVQDKLRIRADDASCARNRYERMLMDLTRAELGRNAEFDTDGFRLLHSPCADLEGISLGRYELPRRNGGSHLYRISHPLAAWVTQQAKSRQLPGSRLVFDYDGYGTQVSTLKAYRGQTGWLTVSLISVDALGQQEQHLIVAATTTTAQGVALAEDDPEKLLRLPAHQKAAGLFSATDGTLAADLATRKVQVLRKINQRNLGYFEQEVEKLDAWADDLKLGLEQEILGLDFEIKEERRTAAISPTLEEKLSHQKRQRDLETKRSKLRRELFTRQDEVEAQRNDLITQLEVQLQQRVDEQTLFTIEWELK